MEESWIIQEGETRVILAQLSGSSRNAIDASGARLSCGPGDSRPLMGVAERA
jgi:hypothetical protein